jgi:DNA-binding transcriptional ArsR family regulator
VSTYEIALDALGDPTRRRIFDLLRRRPRTVSALAAELPVSRPAVSQHLRVLRDARLVSHRAEGTRHVYEVTPEGLDELRTWLEGFWDEALDRFVEAAEQRGRDR